MIRAIAESIRNFSRAADSKGGPLVVPLPHGNCALTAAEAEAFRADFLQEKSFRADFRTTEASFSPEHTFVE